MAGLSTPETVDVVAQDAHGTTLLVMVNDTPWGTYPDEMDRLVAKINTYGIYATTQLHQDYPQTQGRPVLVRLDCATHPPADIEAKFLGARDNFAAIGVDLAIHINPDLA